VAKCFPEEASACDKHLADLVCGVSLSTSTVGELPKSSIQAVSGIAHHDQWPWRELDLVRSRQEIVETNSQYKA
jgi:hypothetical protein